VTADNAGLDALCESLLSRQPKLRVSTIVAENQNTHLASHYSEQKVIAEYSEPRPANVVPEKSISGRVGRNAVLGRFHHREESITQFWSAFPTE
jgi:hypothetical protein